MKTQITGRMGALLALAALAGACSYAPVAGEYPDMEHAPSFGDPIDDDPTSDRPLFRSCVNGAMPQDLPTVRWNRTTNRLITRATPWHSAQDVLAASGGDAVLGAKFSYGSISKDLQGERVQIWIDDCAGGYTQLAERVTDSDGRISFSLPVTTLPGVGEYALYFRVMGDSTAARATLRVYPPQSHFVVFDIDATLTTSDSALVGHVISEILDGDVVPEAREGALEVTELRHFNQGYEVIYLTGRPYLLTSMTRRWLDDLGFPAGTLRLTDSVAAAWPSDSAVGQYKAEYLIGAVNGQAHALYAAYGNATSDIYAYDQAGVVKAQTFILGQHGGAEGTVPLGEAYLEHIDVIAGEPAITQPFRR